MRVAFPNVGVGLLLHTTYYYQDCTEDAHVRVAWPIVHDARRANYRFTTYRHRWRATRVHDSSNELCSRSGGDAREAMTVGCKPTTVIASCALTGDARLEFPAPENAWAHWARGLVGYQPTTCASPPLLEQSSSIQRIVDARRPSRRAQRGRASGHWCLGVFPNACDVIAIWACILHNPLSHVATKIFHFIQRPSGAFCLGPEGHAARGRPGNVWQINLCTAVARAACAQAGC